MKYPKGHSILLHPQALLIDQGRRYPHEQRSGLRMRIEDGHVYGTLDRLYAFVSGIHTLTPFSASGWDESHMRVSTTSLSSTQHTSIQVCVPRYLNLPTCWCVVSYPQPTRLLGRQLKYLVKYQLAKHVLASG